MTGKKLFGTDGVRGHANHFPMNVETALALGKAAGVIFRRHQGKHRVVIGKDTRLSCYMYENALIAGLCSMGVDTLMVGPLPTPGVAFIIRAYRADAGIVISASHNPYHDNGIKFFSNEGYKLPDSIEKEMERLVDQNHFEEYLPADHKIGKNARVVDAYGRYIEFVKGTFPKRLTLKGMKIALDCANGAACNVAPLIFQELDAEVHTYGVEPDGLNINLNCGALHPENIKRAVLEQGCHIGIALDGDADRVILVDEKGQIVDGDTILAICAQDMKDRGLLKNNRVVTTVMSNLGLIQALKGMDIEVFKSKVGDRHVIEMMREYEANLGGEQSGHMVFLDHNTTGDGLVSALQVLKIMTQRGTKLSELASIVKKFPQVLTNIEVKEKVPLSEINGLEKLIENTEEKLKGSGRVLVRYSGTENLMRIMVEASTIKLANEEAQNIADFVKEKKI